MPSVSLSLEGRRAFVLGQIKSELECLRRWRMREQEAIAHIMDCERMIQELEKQLNEIV